MNKTPTRADYCFVFPRKRNADLIHKIASTHLGAKQTFQFHDGTKLLKSLQENREVWSIMRCTEGKIYVVMEIPVIQNFEINWYDVTQLLRSDIFTADIQFGYIVDREVAYTRRLKPETKGQRFDHASTKEFDPDFRDEHGPKKVTQSIRETLRYSRILETTQEKLEADLPTLLEEMRAARWRYE